MTAFKAKKCLENVKMMPTGIKIKCNSGAVSTNQMGEFRRMKVWHLPNKIANIIFVYELKKFYCITYNSWEGFYIVHTVQGMWSFTRMNRDSPTLTWRSWVVRLQSC